MNKFLTSIIAGLAAILLVPGTASAGPLLLVDSIASQCINGQPTITVTLNATSLASYNGQMSFQSPAQLAGTPWPGTNPAMFNVAAGPGSVQLAAPGVASAFYPYPGATCASTAGKGMTWKLGASNPTTGTVDVGCGNECNPYVGDTACTAQLPVLCFNPMAGAGQTKLPVPTNVNNSDAYHYWSGGIVATTPAIAGKNFGTIVAANNYCKSLLGPDWRVAEFHDGWGWNFQAYGGVGQPNQRFWVDIKDQRSTGQVQKGTCWTS